MSAIKQNTIEVLNHLIPRICPEEQEIFDIYSDTFFEQAIAEEDQNRLGDSQYFGDAAQLVSQFLMTCMVTVMVEGGFRSAGKYSWKRIAETFQITKKQIKDPKQAELTTKLEQALKEKAIAQEQIEKLNNELNQQQSKNNQS